MSLISAHWFDAVFVAVIVSGFFHGKNKGAISQIYNCLHWALTLVICSFLYEAPVRWLSRFLHMQPDTVGLMVYPVEVAVVALLLWFARYCFEDKTEKKGSFGNHEQRIAAFAGAVRFFVMLLAGLAWLSGCYVTDADLRAHRKFCDDYFGGIPVPSLSTIHHNVFDESFSGRFVKKCFSPILMEAPPRTEDALSKPQTVPAGRREKRPMDAGDGDNQKGAAQKKPAADDSKQRKDIPEKRANDAPSGAAAKTPPPAAIPEPVRAVEIIYHNLTLRGVSGAAGKKIALINNQSFNEGETADVKMEDKKVRLHCVGITNDAAEVRIEEKTNIITQKGKKTPSIQKVYNAVKKAYGDDYIPSEKVSKKELKERYGISSKWYSAAIAEVPMISANADTLVIVKAKNAASKKKIRSALKKYREELIQDTCQYPMNQLKIQASKVYVKGNYVCFIMLGTISNKQEEQSEDKVIAAYKKQNEKAVKAISKLYK